MIPFWKKTGKDGKKKPQKPAVPRTSPAVHFSNGSGVPLIYC